MPRMAAWLLALTLMGASMGLVLAQTAAPETRTYAAPVERTFQVAESVLRKLGWSIDKRDRRIGWLLTDSRGVDFTAYRLG